MKKRWISWLLGATVSWSASVSGQTAVDLRTQGRNVDFSASTTTKPSRVVAGTLPSSCSAGETVVLLGEGDSARLHVCSTDGHWRTDGVLRGNFSQAFVDSTDVTLTHGAGTSDVVVLCFDLSGKTVEPDFVQVTGPNDVLIRFSAQQSGRCVVNTVSGAAGNLIATGSSDQTEAINAGAGAQLLKAGSNVEARSLIAGPNITVTEGTDTITISSANGETTLAANSGGGAALLKTGTNVTAKTLLGGANVTLVEGTDTVTIHAAPGPVSVGSGLIGSGAAGDPLALDATAVPMMFRQTFSHDFGSIANTGCLQQSFTLTGASVGQTGPVVASSALPPGVNLQLAKVTAANTVAIEICNLSGAAYDPADISYTVMLIQ